MKKLESLLCRLPIDTSQSSQPLPTPTEGEERIIVSSGGRERGEWDKGRKYDKFIRSIVLPITIAAMGIVLADGSQRDAEVGWLRADSKVLAAMEFPLPEDRAGREYLGLSPCENLRLSHVKADSLIVSIFNTYCPICQQGAAHMNELYVLMQEGASGLGKSKLIGIAVGNNAKEVADFRKNYGVEYPVAPDMNFEIEKAFSKAIQTPVCLTVGIKDGTSLEVLDLHVGAMDAEAIRTVEKLVERMH